MKAMLLAAGRGERMRPLTDRCPKPLLLVAGKPLIGWHLERLAQAGVREVVINLSWLGEMVVDVLGDGHRYGLRIAYSREPWPALETGGGIHQALPLLGPDPFLLVNGDVYTDVDFSKLAIGSNDLAQLVLVPNPSHNLKGDFWLDGYRVRAEGGERLTYSGVAIIRPELFNGLAAGRFPLAPLLNRAREGGRLGAHKHSGKWLDIGTPERLAELDAELATVR
jgi:N-acetyl-alpha-D-muramate 1-phosphate uridylyltransferase